MGECRDSKNKMRTIIAYTDGSAVIRGPNSGNGGFGTYFPDFYGVKKAYSFGYSKTKTGRMEIMALYHAISALYYSHKEPIKLIVYSDSEYVVKSFTENRLEKWIKADWTNTSGEVKNRDLWEAILKALEGRKFLTLEMRHIKSHQVEKEKDKEKKKLLLSNPHIVGNMVADGLANYKRHNILLKTDKIIGL